MKKPAVLKLVGVVVFIVSLACGVNVERVGIPFVTREVPEITDLILRYEGLESNRIVYQDFYFFDPDGDADFIQYELIRVIPKVNVEVEDGRIDIPPNAQMQGSIVTGTWYCGSEKYQVTLLATINDEKGNFSNPVEYTLICD